MPDVDRPVLDQLEEAKRRDLVVYLDNDHISAWDEEADEYVVGAHPEEVLRALLHWFGLRHENV